MNKNRILLIGCGRAGNKLVNEMLMLNSRYTGLFVNSEYTDMANLEKFTENSAFVFNNANGSGRNREVAKNYAVNQIESLVDKVVSYPLHDVITIFTSADGGTGSGITPTLIGLLYKTVKSKKLNRKINLVAVMPDCDRADKLALDNSIAFWNDIMKMKDTCLDDIKFIDNTRGNSYEEINKSAVIALDNAYGMNGNDDEVGQIDDNDSKIFNCSKGFGLVLNLPNDAPTTSRAIEIAINNSVFAIPNSFESRYLGISLKKELDQDKNIIKKYKYDDVSKFFNKVKVSTFGTYNEKHNTIVLGGCQPPKDMIEMIKDIANDLEEKSKEFDNTISSEDLIIEKEDVTKKVKTEKVETKAIYTEDDVANIANDVLSFLDSIL